VFYFSRRSWFWHGGGKLGVATLHNLGGVAMRQMHSALNAGEFHCSCHLPELSRPRLILPLPHFGSIRLAPFAASVARTPKNEPGYYVI
jgi:hypothetical protein